MRNRQPSLPFGQLNRISKPTIQDRVDPRTTSFLEAARKAAIDQYEPNTIANRGSYTGIILRVESYLPAEMLPFTSQFFPVGLLPPPIYKVKARIPELHIGGGLPEPPFPLVSAGEADTGNQNWIIDMHPTFIATGPLPYPPAPGDIAILDFEDRENQEGPQLISIKVGRNANSAPFYPNTSTGGVNPITAFNNALTPNRLSVSGPRGGVIRSQSTGITFDSNIITSFENEADVVSGLSFGASAVRNALINELLALGDSSNNEFEKIPEDLAFRIVGAGETGLLALFNGAANWGIQWSPGTNVPVDPINTNWAGVRARSGKHVRDYAYGGVGIPHIDSSFLKRDTYDWAVRTGFGLPSGIPEQYLRNTAFNPMIDGPYADRWLPWAERLVYSNDFQYWSINVWMEKYWEPSARSNETIAQMAVNARVRNSVSGVGRRLAGRSVEEQRQGYYDYKYNDKLPDVARAERASARTIRQSSYALRVPAIVAAYVASNSELQAETATPVAATSQTFSTDQVPTGGPAPVEGRVRTVGELGLADT